MFLVFDGYYFGDPVVWYVEVLFGVWLHQLRYALSPVCICNTVVIHDFLDKLQDGKSQLLETTGQLLMVSSCQVQIVPHFVVVRYRFDKSDNAPVQYPTMHHFVAEICTRKHIPSGYHTDFYPVWPELYLIRNIARSHPSTPQGSIGRVSRTA